MKEINSKNIETNLNVKTDVKSWMRSLIQGISFLIVLFFALILISIDDMQGISNLHKDTAIAITVIYMLFFVYVAIDPNQARITVLGHFKSYEKLLIVIVLLLLTYFVLVPTLVPVIGGI